MKGVSCFMIDHIIRLSQELDANNKRVEEFLREDVEAMQACCQLVAEEMSECESLQTFIADNQLQLTSFKHKSEIFETEMQQLLLEIKHCNELIVAEIPSIDKSFADLEAGQVVISSAGYSKVQLKQAEEKLQSFSKGEAEGAKNAAISLQKQQQKLAEKREQLDDAVSRLQAERDAFEQDKEELESMDTETKEEYLRIRLLEFDKLKRKLEEKQKELDGYIEANSKMQIILASTGEKENLDMEEVQKIIQRQTEEMEELRTTSERKINRLQLENSQLRESLDADKEQLQDVVDQLQDDLEEANKKLMGAYDEIESLSNQIEAEKKRQVQREQELHGEILRLKEEMAGLQSKEIMEKAQETEARHTEAQEDKTRIEQKLKDAKEQLKAVESRDKEEAKAAGIAKMKRSETAKDLYWEVEQLSQDLTTRKKQIQEVTILVSFDHPCNLSLCSYAAFARSSLFPLPPILLSSHRPAPPSHARALQANETLQELRQKQEEVAQETKVRAERYVSLYSSHASSGSSGCGEGGGGAGAPVKDAGHGGGVRGEEVKSDRLDEAQKQQQEKQALLKKYQDAMQDVASEEQTDILKDLKVTEERGGGRVRSEGRERG
eukprot:329984-Hanusia_phi.AAC.2